MELPFEILVYIFKYLPKADRKAASETCCSWFNAANDRCYLRNKVVIFQKSSLNEDNSPHLHFIDSGIAYQNYVFIEVEISNKMIDFWDKLGQNIRSLTLKNCDICEKVFVYMLKRCLYLESLSIQSCRELFMSGRLLEGKTEGLLTEELSNLKRLSLSGNQYLTDALFNRFVCAAPGLKELDLSGCSLQFHPGLIKKFYPVDSSVRKNPSESVLTFFFILQFLKLQAVNLENLILSNTLIDGGALKALAEVENLQLKKLDVHSCDQLTNTGFLSLTMQQTYLKELDIGLCTRVTDQTLHHICDHLINLESLNIQRCRAVTDLGIMELKKLKKLKSINISQNDLITKLGIEKGICNENNSIIEDLDIHSLNLDEVSLIMISENLPKLKFLDVSYCFNAVTDQSIQVIFKNQVLLKSLKLSHCDKVSDSGLTGMGKEGDDENPSMSNYENTNTLPKIHLGSKAEEEIVRDAKRKQEVTKLCENLTMDTYTGYSLACLKSLEELDISSCNKITDVSLTYAFNFKQLITLNLSRCQQITHEGIEHLVKNCPSIENFNLMDCYNLKDEAVFEIVKYLQRLKQIELRGCNQLTDNSLDAIKLHCHKLKYVDVQGCRNISPEKACLLGSIPTLHTVLLSKPGPYVSEGVKNRSPAPAFLPALMRKLRLN